MDGNKGIYQNSTELMNIAGWFLRETPPVSQATKIWEEMKNDKSKL